MAGALAVSVRTPGVHAEGLLHMRNAKLWIFIAAVAVLVVLNHFFGWSQMITDGSLMDWLASLVGERPVLAAVLYVVISFVGCVVLALPGVAFAIFAGLVFGPVMGTLLCWLSMSLGCSLSFLVGRYFLQDAIKPKLQKSKALNKLLFESIGKSDVYLLAITRLVPIFPFNLQNFAYGITDMSFFRYSLFSTLFILPGTAAYTVASAGIVSPGQRVVCFAVAAVLLVATMGVAFVLKRKAGVEK